MLRFSFITNCSSSRTMEPVAKVGKIPPGQTMQSALNHWATQLQESTIFTTPSELYRGLGFSTIAKIQDQFKPEEIHIVTGGQGFITLDEKIVPYDFTANKNEPENIQQAVTNEPFVQSVWWRMINTLRGKSATPIADHVKNTDYDLYLISMGKVFVRYIAEDILSIPPALWPKVKILLSASSVGSVPAQLRPFIIPFDRGCIAHMPGNRNDTSHRAALHYLTLVNTEEWPTLSEEQKLRYFISTTQTNSSGSPQRDINAILAERPELLEMDVEAAYRQLKKEFGTFGGKMFFRAAWRKAKGITITTNPDLLESAAQAMEGMSFLTAPTAQSSTNDEDEALEIIQTFVDALKTFTGGKGAPFTAAQVCDWGKKFYKEKLPSVFEQPNKVAYILKNNFALLGLSETDISGAKSYIPK